MERRIGEDGLGEFARSQIEATRNDPRLGRGRGAMVADFWDAMEEAERTRMLGVLGLHELTKTLERVERELGVSREDAGLDPDVAGRLQAHWERAESASTEIANGYPHLNAQALVSMNSALDALVEEWVPAMQAIRVKLIRGALLERAEQEVPEAAEQLTDEVRERLGEVVDEQIGKGLPSLKPLRGSGTKRYEPRLRQVGLGAPEDRPIPPDFDQALTELGALRDVLTHRAGRVDARALKQAPTLRYKDGDLVRINGEEYRTYSAAVRCFEAEITFRSMRDWPEVTDDEDAPDLPGWRGYYYLGS
jgi:hypothetical protein